MQFFEMVQKSNNQLSKKLLQNTTITLPSYIFRVHTLLILLASFFIHVVVELLLII